MSSPFRLEVLRQELERIAARTAGADGVAVPGFWVGDAAGERRTTDDLASGRLAWRSANRNARNGLAALDAGDEEMAEAYFSQAKGLLIVAYESVITPQQLRSLGTSAERRGRRPEEFALRLSAAMASPSAEISKATLVKALKANPDLDAECGDRSPETLLKSVRRFRGK